jgi:hypothetical protein
MADKSSSNHLLSLKLLKLMNQAKDIILLLKLSNRLNSRCKRETLVMFELNWQMIQVVLRDFSKDKTALSLK